MAYRFVGGLLAFLGVLLGGLLTLKTYAPAGAVCEFERSALCLTSDVDAVVLATELAERMRDVVPTGIGIVVHEGDDMIWFDAVERGSGSRSGTYACQWLYEGYGEPDALIVEACRRAFDDLQDFVDEETTEPWPAARGTPPSACARIEGGNVVIWYGDREHPVLELGSLPLNTPAD
jgi:hypothetical protein